MQPADVIAYAFVLFAALFIAAVALYVRLRRRRKLVRAQTLVVQSITPAPEWVANVEEQIDTLPELLNDLDATLPGLHSSAVAIVPDENRISLTINGKNYENFDQITGPQERQQARELIDQLLKLRESISTFENAEPDTTGLLVIQTGGRVAYRLNGAEYDSLDAIEDPALRAHARHLLDQFRRRLDDV